MAFDPSNRYRDRIESSTATYNNPYRLDRAPARAYETLQRKKPQRQDSAETEQQRLERQLLAEFQRNHFRLPAGRFVIVAEAGKFLILAILLPPYIFFYGMPKWMLEQVAPVVQKGAHLFGEGLERLFLRISAWTTDVFAIASERLRLRKKGKGEKKKPAREGDNLFKLFLKDVRSRLEAMKKSFNEFSTNFERRVDNGLNWVSRVGADLLRGGFRPFRYIGTHAMRISSDWQEALVKRLEKALLAVKKPWGDVKALLESTFSKAAEAAKSGYESIQAAQIRLVEYLSPIVIALLPPAISFFQRQVATPLQTAFQWSTKSLEVIGSIAAQSGSALKEKCASGLQWAAKISVSFSKHLAKPLKKWREKALAELLRRQNGFSEKMRRASKELKRLVQPLKEAFLRIGREAGRKGREFFKKSKDQAKKGCALFKKSAKWAAAELRILPRRVFLWIKYFLIWVYRMFKKVFWGIRVALTWAKIVTVHAIKTLSFSKT